VPAIPLLVRRGGRDLKNNDAKPPYWSGRGDRSQARFGESDHPVCGTQVGFAEIFLMPQPPLLTRPVFGSPRSDLDQVLRHFRIPIRKCSQRSFEE
jgi:hypothetical protein